ncbi:MAG: hypothetical protein WC820_07585, partial [Spirochaetales bacterium]
GLSERRSEWSGGSGEFGRRTPKTVNKGMTMHEKPVSTLKTEEVVSPSENARHRIHGIIDEYMGILRQPSTAFVLFCHYLIALTKSCPSV